MKFKIILKTKNEDNLIDIWIKYYSKMVGKENLIIFDNHSTNQKVLDVYKQHSIEPIASDNPNSINFFHKHANFYENIFSSCDAFAILDTDEFLCVYEDGVFKADKVLDTIQSSEAQVVGSIWLDQMHLSDSIEYFLPNKDWKIDHNKKYGKAIFKTSYSGIKNYIYGHNICCKDAETNTNLILLHLDRTNPEIRIKNCIDLSTIESHNHQKKELLDELQNIKLTDKASNWFLDSNFPDNFMTGVHKLREIQEYYRDKYSYLRKYYGTNEEYIRTNVINHYIYGEQYKQEIVYRKKFF
jgi:hypothetical protein